jgi:hypothetical protein
VAISGDTMVVGAPGANSDLGVAYVYTGSSSTWSYATTLNPAGVTNDGCTPVCQEFGSSVAVKSGTIVVGAPGVGVNASGASFVYTGSGSNWTQQAELTDPGQTSGDDFGDPVAVSSKSTVMVSAATENSFEGAVFVYTKSGSVWPTVPTATLTAPGAEGAPGYGELFGEGLAVSSTTVVVGAPGDPGATDPVPSNCNASASAGCSSGAVYVYKEVDGGWIEQAKLTASNGEGCSATCSTGADYMGGDYFGWSVAITGKTVAVGAPWATAPSPPSSTGPEPDGGTSDAPSSTGTAYAFTGSGASWTQRDELYSPAEATAGVQDWFGYNVAVLGHSIVAAAPYDSAGYANYYTTGAAYVFQKAGDSWATYPTELTASNPPAQGPSLWFGYGLAAIGTKYVAVGDPYSYGTAEAVYIFKD